MQHHARERDSTFLLAGRYRRLAWREWGRADAPSVLCVHGLTRNAHDFDALGAALADEYRVVAPDLPGRGRSEWLDDPVLYTPASYVVALSHLLAVIAAPVRWVGTSLGGICGLMVAATPGAPVASLVLNDVGGFIPAAALTRIAAYLRAAPASFADLAALEAYLRVVHAPFGTLSDAQWHDMARHSARALPDRSVALHYDPAIARPMLAAEPVDVDLWPVWTAVTVPRLVLRGQSSDLLDPATLARMCRDGARGHEVAGAGHAPALQDAPTIAVIRGFLDAG